MSAINNYHANTASVIHKHHTHFKFCKCYNLTVLQVRLLISGQTCSTNYVNGVKVHWWKWGDRWCL